MPEELTPVIREEEYLAAIAGQDVTPPDPATRKEEWLDAIADHQDAIANHLDAIDDHLEAVAPTPAAADSGKVLTAGSDGTASWQNVSGGDGPLIVHATGIGQYSENDGWTVQSDAVTADLQAAVDWTTGEIHRLVYVQFPAAVTTSPYWNYTGGSAVGILDNPEGAMQEVGSVRWIFGYNGSSYVFRGREK